MMRVWVLRSTAATALATLALALMGSSASAETWRQPERSGDVGTYSYSPDPAPCGSLSESAAPSNVTLDIVSLAVRHDKDTVALRARFRDLTTWANRGLSFDLQTDGKAFEIQVDRPRKGAPVAAALYEGRKIPDQTEECGLSVEIIEGRPCRELSVEVAPDQDRVTVVMARQCIHKPRWIRAGVHNEVYRHGTWFWDAWAPRDTDAEALIGPFGPKVRRG